jgi:hypothetical protein
MVPPSPGGRVAIYHMLDSRLRSGGREGDDDGIINGRWGFRISSRTLKIARLAMCRGSRTDASVTIIF